MKNLSKYTKNDTSDKTLPWIQTDKLEGKTCKQCGACCENIIIPHTKKTIKAWCKKGKHNRMTYAFILKHWKRKSKKRALQENPVLKLWDKLGLLKGSYFYECEYVDKATGRCSNYDGRPPICRKYPNPDGIGSLGLSCDCGYVDRCMGMEDAKRMWNIAN